MRFKKYLLLIIIFIIVFLFHILFLWLLTTIKFQKKEFIRKNPTEITFQSMTSQVNPNILPPDPLSPVSHDGGGMTDNEFNEITTISNLNKENLDGIPDEADSTVTDKEPISITTQIKREDVPKIVAQPEGIKKRRIKKKTDNLPMSIAQLTQGFINNLNTNQSGIKTITRKQGQVSGAQLAIENYESKVMTCIMMAIKRNLKVLPKNLPNEQLVLQLIVKRDGSLYNVCLKCSTGNSDIDTFMLTMVQEASNGFPQFPPAIAGNIYNFPAILFPKFSYLIDILKSGHEIVWHKTANS